MSLIDNIIDYAKVLEQENLSRIGDTIAVRKDDKTMLITKTNANFSCLCEKDILEVNYQETDSDFALVFDRFPNANVVFHVKPQNIAALAKAKKSIPPVLDDMAQIVGTKAVVVKNDKKRILKALRKKQSVLIENMGALITGRSLNECHTAARVLEKTAFVYIASKVLGGAKRISRLEAWLMHTIYKMKYSKKNQELKIMEERTDD